MTPKTQDDAPFDARPVYRIAVFGLGHRFQRLLEIIVRHARHNPVRYQVAEQRGPGEFDIALVDMTVKGGNEVARTLRSVPQALPVIGVGRRANHRRGADDLLLQSFSLDVLGVLNAAAGALTLRERTRRLSSRLVQAAPGVRLPRVGGRAPRTLVVDPSPSIRSQVAVALRQIGVDAEGVGSLAQAEDVLSMRSYELMIIEPQQPDGDGIDLLHRLRHESSLSVPVIVLSSRTGLRDLARAAWVGCSGYLGKPVALSMLHATVGRVLARSLRPRLAAERRADAALHSAAHPGQPASASASRAASLSFAALRDGPVTLLRRAMRAAGGDPAALSGPETLVPPRLPADPAVRPDRAPAPDVEALGPQSGSSSGASSGESSGAPFVAPSGAPGSFTPSIESAIDAMASRAARAPAPIRSLKGLFRP